MTTERRIPAGHVTPLSRWLEAPTDDTIVEPPGVSLPDKPMLLWEVGMERGMTQPLFVTYMAHFPLHSRCFGGR